MPAHLADVGQRTHGGQLAVLGGQSLHQQLPAPRVAARQPQRVVILGRVT